MNHQALADEISFLLATETRSLARHLEEAVPYLSAPTYRIWHKLKHLSQASREHAKRLSALQESLELPPRPHPFSPEVANYHYVDVAFLLPKLIDEKQSQIAAYRRAIRHAQHDEQVKAELESLLADNETQLQTLEHCNRDLTANPAPADVS